MSALPKPKKPIVYPETDGKPMAENTVQFRWIVTIEGGLEALFAHHPNVFVAGDLFWYPVEGDPTIVQAPDIFVAFGRPKGDRRSYMQWLEGGIPPRVVFEVQSPSNRLPEMTRKFTFYERYGVDEYYVYDPEPAELFGWIRKGDRLVDIPSMRGWVSPALGIRFEMVDDDFCIYRPDGVPFVTFAELHEQAAEVQQELERAEQAKAQAEQAKVQAEQAKVQAEQAKVQAEQAKLQAQSDSEQLRAQLRALGIDPKI